MTELDGFERFAIGERFPSDEYTPPLSPDNAGAAILASSFFPAGDWLSGMGDPNQAVRWGTVSAVTGSQGGAVLVPCIPGRQYTWSGYTSQGASSTIQAAVTDLTAGDLFNRTTAAGWGTRDSGGTWTVSGTAADYATAQSGSGGTATHSLTSVNTARTAVSGSSIVDSTQVVTVSTSAVAAGASITVGLIARYADASNYYRAVVTFNTDQTINTTVVKTVAGVDTTVSSTATTLTHVAGTSYSIRFTVVGTTVQARTWLASATEPTTWDVNTTDTTITSAGAVGCYSRLTTGNSNTLPVTVTFSTWLAATLVQVGTTTFNRPLEWTRLSITFTATQPQHTVGIQTVSTSTTLPGNGFLDNVQIETGSSTSTFATTGAVNYPIMRNFVERWPRQWSAAGFEGFVQSPGVDAFAALNAIALQTEYREAVLSLTPDYYWPMSDGVDTTNFFDITGTGAPLAPVVSKYGAGSATLTPGTATGIVGDPGGVGESIGVQTGLDAFGYTLRPTVINSVALAASTATWSVTVSCWYSTTIGTGATTNYLISLFGTRVDVAGTPSLLPALQMLGGNNSGANPWMSSYNGSTGGNLNLTGTVASNLNDGTPHLYVGVFSLTANVYTQTMYIDGTQVATGSASASATFGSATPAFACSTLMVCGEIDQYINGPGQAGIYSHVAAWNRALTAAEITTLWSAGGLGYAGETSGTRIARHLSIGGYVGDTRISTGQSTMQPPSWTGTIDLLTDSQNTVVAEQGDLWVAPDGALVFEARNDRFLRLTSTYTLGENESGGEWPYVGDIEFDYDPNFVYSDVTVTRNNGSTASGGTLADVTAAAKRYFPRAYSASVDLETDMLAQYEADWIFNTHKAALLRVASITLDPASNTSLWPVALSIEVGMRITVIRRPSSANSGVGFTMSASYFVEQVSHDAIDMAAGTWTTTLYVSPIGVAPGVNVQPWILGNTTYSVLGSTTMLGW